LQFLRLSTGYLHWAKELPVEAKKENEMKEKARRKKKDSQEKLEA